VKLGLRKNSKGFSIIQALVAAAITSIVSLGVVSMLESSRKVQRRTSLFSTLNELRTRIETNLRDQTAFNNTINSNLTAPFSQIRSGSSVTQILPANAVKFVMYEAGGVAWDLLGTAASDTVGPYNGFSEKGTPCSTFSPVAGSGTDECPISYRLLISAECTLVSPCKDPQLTVGARLVYNPSTSGKSTLNQWRGIIQQVSGSSLASTPEKFDVQIKRSATSISKYFTISASVNPTTHSVLCDTADITDTGGGKCSTASKAIHPLTIAGGSTGGAGWVVENDANSMVSVNTGAGSFSFATTGYYKCSITAKAFSSNVTFYLYDNGVAMAGATGSAIASTYAEALAKFDVAFNATAGHSYTLYQQCSDNSLRSCTLGFAKGSYPIPDDSNKMVIINCERVDVSY